MSSKILLTSGEARLFRIEGFRWRGLIVVLALCGLMAGICSALTPNHGPVVRPIAASR